jgi:transcriptional regulator with XRE-family HTH domain
MFLFSYKIHDVAKIAGVSSTTVSRVLNNRGYISEKTKEKVAHGRTNAFNMKGEFAKKRIAGVWDDKSY